ncbi:MAG: aminotransferase class V-fold PLP-dependent enzyme [Myxococcales bacterium]|nr:aminotransferase class V-fold PLP-dependent enzyme [Myxococcales bacterium]
MTGLVQPIGELCRVARDHDLVTVIDAAQSAPHLPLRVTELGCAFLAFSGHKMLGPTGVGCSTGDGTRSIGSRRVTSAAAASPTSRAGTSRCGRRRRASRPGRRTSPASSASRPPRGSSPPSGGTTWRLTRSGWRARSTRGSRPFAGSGSWLRRGRRSRS